MNTTSPSLLQRLRNPTNTSDWQHMVEVYTPLLHSWLRRWNVQATDADDLVQDILTVVAKRIDGFCHDGRRGSFRAWLKAIMVNRLRDFWRNAKSRPTATSGSNNLQSLDQLEDPHSDLSKLWDEDHDRHLLRRLLVLVEPEFQPLTWQAFCRHVLEDEGAADVAASMGKSVNAVLIAKSRVLQRLREEARGLLNEDSGFF